jgi:hypothetical protein
VGAEQQKKGARAERELCSLLRGAGYDTKWGGNNTHGTKPDVYGLPGIHIECKDVENLNLAKAMNQSERDSKRFRDGAPTVFHRKNNVPWLVTMRLQDWLTMYKHLDHDPHAVFYVNQNTNKVNRGESMKTHFWEDEKPIKAITDKNVLEYYARAKRLSIAKPDWENGQGERKRGKTVFLDLVAAKGNEDAIRILDFALSAVKGE